MDTRINLISKHPSCLDLFVRELRDVEIQRDRLRFRTNLTRVGEVLAYEISKALVYTRVEVTTPLGVAEMPTLLEQPVIATVLRAGLPFHEGFLRFFDQAENGFVSAYRHHTHGDEFVVKVEYQAAPELSGKTLILCDPMVATGRSLVKSYEALLERGAPDSLFVAAAIASEEGLEYLLRHIPAARVYVAAIDRELTARGYIVPGLGDAGDLAYGPK